MRFSTNNCRLEARWTLGGWTTEKSSQVQQHGGPLVNYLSLVVHDSLSCDFFPVLGFFHLYLGVKLLSFNSDGLE